jgi:CRISPR-associated endoribonuclease Cas6
MQYQHRDDIPANTPCWWRISLLDDKLFNHLSQVWSTALPQQTWYLGSARLNITSLASTAQQNPAWASSCSYQALYEQASDQQRDLHLQFLTPASFRLAGYVSPLPTRDALFHCLRRRWNRYSGLAFAPDLVSPIVATEFQLHTVTVSEPTANRVGCLGQMRFQILGDVDRLTIKRINTLVDFTRYCSVGAQTMSGMGLMHRLHPTAAGDHGMASDS